MRKLFFWLPAALAVTAAVGVAQQAPATGPYKVLKAAKVGGEGGHDYLYADAAGRRLYIPRTAGRGGAAPAAPAPGTGNRISVYNLDTLEPVGEVAGVTNGNGAVVDPKSGHGFASTHPSVTMFDTKTLKVIKTIPVAQGNSPDGIYFDPFNERVYVFSHPTHDATVIDAKDGTVVGTIDLGGTPEEAVGDGKGTLYVVMQDRPGGVAVVDVKAMKTTAHYPFGENGGCNGLALDAKNQVLFAACSAVGAAPARGQAPGAPRGQAPPPAVPGAPPPQQMVILSAKDGRILARLPLAGGSDGAVFNPATKEAFSSHSNGTMTIVKEKSPTSFEVEQNLQTMNGARTLTLDSKTNRLFVMSEETGPPPAPSTTPPAGGRGGGRGQAIPGSFTILMIGMK